MQSPASLCTGENAHLLDHLAPLAHLLNMPLLITEEKGYLLARHYYPQTSATFAPHLEENLLPLAQTYDTLFACQYWAPHLSFLFESLYQTPMNLIFCPHGQSDKGFEAPLLAPYSYQPMALFYGNLLKNMLNSLQIDLPPFTFVGNYRLFFYQKHRAFYDHLVQTEVLSQLDPQKNTLLYAPTWKDLEDSSSFFSYGAHILSQKDPNWNLLVKVHPLLEQRNPESFYRLAAIADRNPHVTLLSSFLPVYPLLAISQAYLGDFSSVGYDFLVFQRPLLFLPSSRTAKLRSCGTVLQDPDDLYFELEKAVGAPCRPSHQPLLQEAFFPFPGEALLKQQIIQNLKGGESKLFRDS